MHLSLLPLALLATSALASKPTFRKSHSFHAMLARGASLSARQDSYQPETSVCDLGGDTCETACGAASTECPSGSEETMYCYDKTMAQCCPGGSGSTCENGFYCASGDAGDAYCCMDGLDPALCAQAYSQGGTALDVTVTLHSTITLPSPPPQSATTTSDTSELSGDSSLSTPTPTPTSVSSRSRSPSPSPSPSPSALTSSSTAPSQPSVTFAGEPIPTVADPSATQSTGGVAKVAVAGMAALAGVIGVAELL